MVCYLIQEMGVHVIFTQSSRFFVRKQIINDYRIPPKHHLHPLSVCMSIYPICKDEHEKTDTQKKETRTSGTAKNGDYAAAFLFCQF